MDQPMTPTEFHQAEGLRDWRVLGDGAGAFFASPSLARSARFVQAVAEIDGVDDHPPAIDIRPGGVTVRLVTLTDEFMGMTARDVDFARRMSAIANELGMASDPARVQHLLIVPGAPDVEAIKPFWRAVLGYEPRPDSPDDDLVDPQDRSPGFWFEPMDQPRADGGGAIHVAVWVAPEEAEARVAAAVAAGGHIVRADYAPSWWTLADAFGNEADVATTTGRD
jgi:4a-hydroxytetrahydrobiopterin dehydratase